MQLTLYLDFPGSSGVKNMPANAGDTGHIPDSGRSNILAWKIPWTERPVGYSPWGHMGRL